VLSKRHKEEEVVVSFVRNKVSKSFQKRSFFFFFSPKSPEQ